MEDDTTTFVYNGGPIPDDVDTNNITHIHVNDGVTYIPNDTFREWSQLKSVIISDGNKRIGAYAFEQCRSLTYIHLPDSLETIDGNSFYGCSNLKYIRLPPNISRIGGFAFSLCSSLSNIDIPPSMTSIEDDLFLHCKSLVKVTIPTSVSTIKKFSFADCKSIVSIKLHDTIQVIERSTFACCSSLLSIQVPPSVKEIEIYALSSCTSLRIIYCPSAAMKNFFQAFCGYRNSSSNIILLTDRQNFIHHEDQRISISSITLRDIQQCIENIPNNNNQHNDFNTDNSSTSTTVSSLQQQQLQLQTLHQVFQEHFPHIAQKAQNSGFNLLHLLVYFPGDILQPLTMLLDKCPLIATAVDNTGRTAFHHVISSTRQNMDAACYDLLASRTSNKIVCLALQSGAPWHEVYDVVKAKVNGLEVQDDASGLIPFMMVAERGSDYSKWGLSAVYELLCMKPDVLSEYANVNVNDGNLGYENTKMSSARDDGDVRAMKRRR